MTAVDDIRGTASVPGRRIVVSLLRRMVSEEGQANPQPYRARLRALGDVVPAPWGAYFVTGFGIRTQVPRRRNWLVPDFVRQRRRPDPERRQALATQEMARTLSRLGRPVHTRTALPTKSQSAVSAQATSAIRDFFTSLLAEHRAHLDNDAAGDVLCDWIRYRDSQDPARTAWLREYPQRSDSHGPARMGPARMGPARMGPTRMGPTRTPRTRPGPPGCASTRNGPTRMGPARHGPTHIGPTRRGPTRAARAPISPSAAASATASARTSPGSRHAGSSPRSSNASPPSGPSRLPPTAPAWCSGASPL